MANHKAGYAIVTLKEILEEGILLPDTSSKKAEIITLTEALHLNESEIIIYSDSKYAFLVMHAMGNLEGGGLLISKSKKIKYVQEILRLLDVIQKPKEATIMHCPGDQKSV